MRNENSKPISIRRFNKSDMEQMIRLVSEIHSSEDLTAEARVQFTRELEANCREEARFVADHAGAVVGTMGCGRGPIPSKCALWADWLIVAPEFRRQGVATALYSEVEAFAIRLNKRYLCLDIGNIDVERAAYAFHSRNGFQITGQIPDYWGELEHFNIMTKSLI